MHGVTTTIKDEIIERVINDVTAVQKMDNLGHGPHELPTLDLAPTICNARASKSPVGTSIAVSVRLAAQVHAVSQVHSLVSKSGVVTVWLAAQA